MGEDTNKGTRERSGEVTSNDPMVAFLYVLMRDHLPPGVVAELVNSSQPEHRDVLVDDGQHLMTCFAFTNGWLARYAEDLVDRLKKIDK